VSRYRIRFEGKATPEQIEALGKKHDEVVKRLAAEIEPNAQGSFGIDQVEGTFSTYLVGEQAGDHLETVRSAFESAGSELSGLGSDVTGTFSYIDDEGVQTDGEYPAAPAAAAAETPAPE